MSLVLLLLALTRDTWRQLEEGPSTCPAQECLQRQGHMWILSRSEVILKKSSNLYCMLELRRVLMVGTKVSKGFFV